MNRQLSKAKVEPTRQPTLVSAKSPRKPIADSFFQSSPQKSVVSSKQLLSSRKGARTGLSSFDNEGKKDFHKKSIQSASKKHEAVEASRVISDEEMVRHLKVSAYLNISEGLIDDFKESQSQMSKGLKNSKSMSVDEQVCRKQLMQRHLSLIEAMELLDLNEDPKIVNQAVNQMFRQNIVRPTNEIKVNLAVDANRRSSSFAVSDQQRREAHTGSNPEMAQSDSPYQVIEKGNLYSSNYRLYFKGPNGLISPWHDIPLYADEPNKIFNMVVEIPRWSNAKMEIATAEPLNPIKQDEKNNAPRFVHNIFPHKGYIWNYGALPQTWEDPNHKDEHTSALGDNDPIDIVEIGEKVQKRGAVVQVKVLGVIALLDEGETDWKLISIDVTDPLAKHLNDIHDVEAYFPGLLSATFEWFRIYKVPAGKKVNSFGFNGQFKERAFAHSIIDQTSGFWKQLIKEQSPKLNTQTHVEGAAHLANDDQWKALLEEQPSVGPVQPIPDSVDKWHYINATKTPQKL